MESTKRIKASELFSILKDIPTRHVQPADLFFMSFWVTNPNDDDAAWFIQQDWADSSIVEFNVGGCGEAYRWYIDQLTPQECADIVCRLIGVDTERIEWAHEEDDPWIWIEE